MTPQELIKQKKAFSFKIDGELGEIHILNSVLPYCLKTLSNGLFYSVTTGKTKIVFTRWIFHNKTKVEIEFSDMTDIQIIEEKS